jgi:DNA-binding LytR/AlgR family response regulator
VDYLLKPVPFERLREAIKRAKQRLQARAADVRFAELQSIISALSARDPDAPRFEREIWVKEREGVIRVAVDTVDLFEAAGDYVIAHVGENTHLLNDSLSALEERLDPEIMLRVHRSVIANLARVRGIRRRGSRGLALIMQSGRQLPIGPTYLDGVMKSVKARRWRDGSE